jgi:type I restriction enzyme S subunit
MNIPLKKLSKIVRYSDARIDAADVSLENFITTDNILQNKAGITTAASLPPGDNAMPKYAQGNILLANIRPYLKKIWFADKSGGCSADVLVFAVNKEYDPKFVYYAMFRDDFFYHIMKGAKGTKMPRGDKNQILEFLIPDFDLPTQHRIAAVLSALDAKIDLNKRINAELEALAKTLYDYWFVQFDFPDKRGKPYKTSGGAMVWNEELKRDVPAGWKVGTLAAWLDCSKSGDWGKEEQEGNYTLQVTCIRGTDINGLNGLANLQAPTRFILEKNDFKILDAHDVIIEISGGSTTQSTGRIGFITEATMKRFETPLICSNFCKPVSLKNTKLLYNFVYYWETLYRNGVFFGYEGKTSGIKNLLFDAFVDDHITVTPALSVASKFYDIMEDIQAQKQILLQETQELSALRDYLLPLLMNGQVVVGSGGAGMPSAGT